MKKLTEPPKSGKFITCYIDNYEAHAMVCKWDESLGKFVAERDTYHGVQWWPVKFGKDYWFIGE